MRDSGNNIGKWQHVACSKTVSDDIHFVAYSANSANSAYFLHILQILNILQVSDNINFVCERKTECGYTSNIGWAGKK